MRHTYLPLKQRQPKRAAGATMLMLSGALTSPSHCKEAAPCDSNGFRSHPRCSLFFSRLFIFGRCVGEGEKKKSLTAFSYLFDPKRLSRNGRNGYHGLNASEGEKASPSNQFRGWVRARFPQTAPDPSGGVQGELADVRCQRRARSRSISEAKWPFGDFLSNHSDAGAGKRVKVSCCLGRGRAI